MAEAGGDHPDTNLVLSQLVEVQIDDLVPSRDLEQNCPSCLHLRTTGERDVLVVSSVICGFLNRQDPVADHAVGWM
nr:hypothetical protein JVH1_3278 [Rhodococcus sp. JVH1]